MDEDPHSTYYWVIVLIAVLSFMAILVLIPSKTVSYDSSINEKSLEEIKEEVKFDKETEYILESIAFCESTDRHYDENGDVLRGVVNSKDIGRYQINKHYWIDRAEELGINIFEEDGNKKMAYYILTEGQGIEAWSASARCLERFGIFINNN